MLVAMTVLVYNSPIKGVRPLGKRSTSTMKMNDSDHRASTIQQTGVQLTGISKVIATGEQTAGQTKRRIHMDGMQMLDQHLMMRDNT
jgi:hypothetical protein